MGLYSGAVSFWRYKILNEKTISLEELSKALKQKELFGVLSPGAWEKRVGWVCPPLEEGEEWFWENWDLSHCHVKDSGGYVLRMRVEERKVSQELSQLLWREKRTSVKEDLSKKEWKALKEEFKAELLQKTLPKVSHVDVFWQDHFKEVLCFASGKKSRDLFESLFQETFGALLGPVVLLSVGLMGEDRDEKKTWTSEEELWKSLESLSGVSPLTHTQTSIGV